MPRCKDTSCQLFIQALGAVALWLLASDIPCYQFMKHRPSLKGFCFTRHNFIKDLSTARWQKAFPCDRSV